MTFKGPPSEEAGRISVAIREVLAPKLELAELGLLGSSL